MWFGMTDSWEIEEERNRMCVGVIVCETKEKRWRGQHVIEGVLCSSTMGDDMRT